MCCCGGIMRPGRCGKGCLILGLLPNVTVLVVRAAPLNDPIALRLDGTDISLRRQEAATIEVIES